MRRIPPGQTDPMAEAMYGYSPYNAMGCNPVSFNDPEGDIIGFVIGAALVSGFISGMRSLNDGRSFWGGFTVGALAGAAGVWTGAAVAVGTGFINGAAIGAAGGFTQGFISGTGNTLIRGGSFSSALSAGLENGFISAVKGAVIAGVAGGIDALSKNVNFFTGKVQLDLSSGYGAHDVAVQGTITGKYIGKYEGVSVYEADIGGGIALPGRGIVVYNGAFSKNLNPLLVQHEFGHILQAREYGLRAFYKVIGPESLVSAARHGIRGHVHDYFWTETWANYKALEYFGQRYVFSIKYPIENISTFNVFKLKLARLGPFWPF